MKTLAKRTAMLALALSAALTLSLGLGAAPAEAAAKIKYPTSYTFASAATTNGTRSISAKVGAKPTLRAQLKATYRSGYKVAAHVDLQRKVGSGSWVTIKKTLSVSAKYAIKVSAPSYGSAGKITYRFKSNAYKVDAKRGVAKASYSKTLTVTYKKPSPTVDPQPDGTWDTTINFSTSYFEFNGSKQASVVGNGGQLNIYTAFGSQYYDGHEAAPKLTLQRQGADGSWSTILEGLKADSSNKVEVLTPVYSTSAASENIAYRFASLPYTAGSNRVPEATYSDALTITYENQSAYTGLQQEAYAVMQPYCPNSAVHVADPANGEAGSYTGGQLLIKLSPSVADMREAFRRTVYLHECAHERQFVNWGSTGDGWDQMKVAMAQDFINDAAPADAKPTPSGSGSYTPIEHAADCAAFSINPDGYLGYGGYCNASELAYGRALITGQKL